jgi:hypothetical protein
MSSITKIPRPLTLTPNTTLSSHPILKNGWGLLIAVGIMVILMGLGSSLFPKTPTYQGEDWHGNSAGSALERH